MIQNQNWKKRLYDAYVSSGQASDSVSSDKRLVRVLRRSIR